MNQDPLLAKINEALRKAIDMQINDNEPPETRLMMEKLIGLGHSPDQCYEMISRVLALEYKLIHEGNEFDFDRYRENLLKLGEPLPGN